MGFIRIPPPRDLSLQNTKLRFEIAVCGIIIGVDRWQTVVQGLSPESRSSRTVFAGSSALLSCEFIFDEMGISAYLSGSDTLLSPPRVALSSSIRSQEPRAIAGVIIDIYGIGDVENAKG